MPSSVIKKFWYHPAARELEILFTTGRRYIYSDVPEDEVERFRTAFSKGTYFNHYIRDHYPYREIEGASH